MHDDIQVTNGVWKFTGNPSLICKCLPGKGCIQFPEKNDPFNDNPFVSKDPTKASGKICTRVWKFHQYKICERCGEAKKDVSVRLDPYQKEIEEIEIEICVCDDCENIIAEDI